MSNGQHTRGPWTICLLQGKYPYIVADHGKKWDNPTICDLFQDVTPEDSVTMMDWFQKHPNAEANAILIAAAPDLLQELKSAKETMECMQSRIDSLISRLGGTDGFGEYATDIKTAELVIDKAEGRAPNPVQPT